MSAPETTELPAALRQQSLAPHLIILPLQAAIEAIDHFARAGRRLESWEGWVKMRDGGRARSLAHSGSFALPGEAQRAAEAARTGMQHAQARWDRNPEYPNATLYFGLTFARAT